MACKLLRSFCKNVNNRAYNCIHISSRNGHHMRGHPPESARNLEQRLAELNYKDPAIYYRVDIGLAPRPKQRGKELQERLAVVKANRQNKDLEKKTRNKELLVDLDEVQKDWIETSGPYLIKRVADHYGVFQHLFGDAYFAPQVHLDIAYNISEDKQLPVFYGNIIKPSKAREKPEVAYKSDENTLWTLILTNPDGHFTETESEYVHWFIGNIPGNKIENGETLVEYMQPFPPRGTGLHRHIFILYKQEQKIDFSEYRASSSGYDLSERTFKTLDFYRKHQDNITPAGLAFFQSDWDHSLTDFYHNILNMEEPVFEYDFPKPYIRPQEWFPRRKAFNIYMDKYRDPKQINKEFLIRKLKSAHPFKPPVKPLPFPNAVKMGHHIPSWLKTEIEKSRMKWGRVNDIE